MNSLEKGIAMKKMYINGEWIEGTSGKTFQSVNPATGAVNAEICQSSLEDTKALSTPLILHSMKQENGEIWMPRKEAI